MFVLLENRMSALQVPAPEQGVWVLKTAQRCNLSSDYSAVLFPPPKKIKIVSILASKYLSMYPLSDGRLFMPCDLVYNLASFLNPL